MMPLIAYRLDLIVRVAPRAVGSYALSVMSANDGDGGGPGSVLAVAPLGFPWQTADPFLFCVHHDDRYPAGNEEMGPAASLVGRELGMDFEGKDGWRMYHGEVVPGFPQHPHRGFETVTIVRHGFIDHSDSLGATARFGGGDVQWLTAGRGVVHSEMFPLLERDGGNPLELFQIWLNLPHADKMVDPHFAMLWRQDIPREETRDDGGKRTLVTRIAGTRAGDKAAPPPPPPRSWAARPDTDVAIWTIEMEPGARWILPPARPGTNRNLYFFRGDSLRVAGQSIPRYHSVALRPDVAVEINNDHPAASADILLLQARPISEPVVQHGPFVMSTPEEIRQAMLDYHRTRFGGWPWPSDAPVHPRDAGRFARHADGRVERGE
jgi:quercetin 2,3-dioxygenase